jgi:transcription initiation factor IIE alpha subunit
MSHFSRNFPGYWVTTCPACKQEASFEYGRLDFECEECGAKLRGIESYDVDSDGTCRADCKLRETAT